MRLRRDSRSKGLVFVFVCLFVFLFVWRSEAHAAAVPAYNGKMNTAVGGVISDKVNKWGFAANDPRVGATFNAVASGIGAVALGGVGVALGAASWPAVLVGAGISALLTGAISLGQDSLYKWLFNSDGTLTSQGLGNGAPAALVVGGQYFSSSCGGDGTVFASSYAGAGDACARRAMALWGGVVTYTVLHCSPAEGCRLQRGVNPSVGLHVPLEYDIGVGSGSNYAGTACASGMYGGGACISSGAPLTVTAVSPANAIANIPDTELAKPVSDELLAAAANTAWQEMPAGQGLPWSASDPITPADVANWKAVNPGSVPSVGDAIAPIAPPGASSVPMPAPGSVPETGPAPTPGEGDVVNLGPDPNIPAPGLEATPTAQMILGPILALMPDLKSFAVPAHSAVCPSGSFDALGRSYVINSHCQLIETNRNIIEAAMTLVWSILGVFIVLRA